MRSLSNCILGLGQLGIAQDEVLNPKSCKGTDGLIQNVRRMYQACNTYIQREIHRLLWLLSLLCCVLFAWGELCGFGWFGLNGFD